MVTEWSTFDLPRQSQFEYWREEVICKSSIPLIPYREGTGAFRGLIRKRKLGQCSILELAADAHGVKHSSSEINGSADDYYSVKLVQHGHGFMTQHGRTVPLKPGDLLISDSNYPFDERFEESFAISSFQIPRSQLAPYLVNPMKAPTVFISTSSDLGPLIRSFLKELARLPEAQYGSYAVTLNETLCHLLSVALEPGNAVNRTDDRGPNLIRFLSVKSYIRENLSNPELSPGTVAADCGISVRYLHKLFKPHGLTFCQWLLKSRLERCRAQIADPRFGKKNLSMISYDWGFKNPSHFGRAFRSVYGVCPRDYRKQVFAKQDCLCGN